MTVWAITVPLASTIPREGSGIGSRGTPDRALVYLDKLVDVPDPFDGVVRKRTQLGPVELVLQDRHQSLIDERRLAASAHSGHTYETAEGEGYVNILEVVAPRTFKDE